VLRLAIDENFNQDIVRGLLRRSPNVDLQSVQDASLSGVGDPEVLAWAAEEGGVLLTHDVQTMTRYAYARIEAGEPMPGGLRSGAHRTIGSRDRRSSSLGGM
jgi:predicted nuclease of predicted toxin-antitoxin system